MKVVQLADQANVIRAKMDSSGRVRLLALMLRAWCRIAKVAQSTDQANVIHAILVSSVRMRRPVAIVIQTQELYFANSVLIRIHALSVRKASPSTPKVNARLVMLIPATHAT